MERKWCQACIQWVEYEDFPIGAGYYDFVMLCVQCASEVADEPINHEPEEEVSHESV